MAAHQIVPFDRRCMIKPETPVRYSAFRDCCSFGWSLIDRGKAPAQQDLAPQLKFLWRFIAGIDAALRLQGIEVPFIEIEPCGLARLFIPGKAQPVEIGPDLRDIFFLRSLHVRVIDAKNESPALLFRPQPVVQGSADISDMQGPGRGWRKARRDGHAVRNALVIG